MSAEHHRSHSFNLDEPLQMELRLTLKQLGIRQIGLSKRIGVSQSWISSLLNGAPIRDRGSAEFLIREVRQTVEQRNLSGIMSDEQAAQKFVLLDEILDIAGINARKPLAVPTGLLPIDAANYVHRTKEEGTILRILNYRDRRNYQFNLIVSGPPDSGKSTALAYLQRAADQDKVQTVFVPCWEASDPPSSNAEKELSRLVHTIARSMEVTWSLQPPKYGPVNDYIELLIYLDGAMKQASPDIKRLLIIDGLEDLQYEGCQRAVIAFAESMRDHQANRRAKFAIALGFTPDTPILQDHVSIGWDLEVGWFDQGQVLHLAGTLGGNRLIALAPEVYDQFGGQPFLTHVALDRLGDDKLLTPKEVYRDALAGEVPFAWHLSSIRKILSDSDAETAFQLMCEEGELNPAGLVSSEVTESLRQSGLVVIKHNDEADTLIPRSRYYQEIGTHIN